MNSLQRYIFPSFRDLRSAVLKMIGATYGISQHPWITLWKSVPWELRTPTLTLYEWEINFHYNSLLWSIGWCKLIKTASLQLIYKRMTLRILLHITLNSYKLNLYIQFAWSKCTPLQTFQIALLRAWNNVCFYQQNVQQF